MANNDTGAGTVMLAFVVGALTGAAVALLFAPASGEETREYLGQQARDRAARARDAVNEGREMYQRQRENLNTAVERGRETLNNAVERGREAFQQAKDRGEQNA